MMRRGRVFTDTEWIFLQRFLNALKDEGIAAPILRNYDGLPKHVGNDLDVFISRSNLQRAEDILVEQVVLSGGNLVKKFRKDSFTAWWMRIGDSPLLHIDLFNGAFYWRGRLLESDCSVEEGMLTHKLGFSIPRPMHQSFSMFVTSLIWGGFYQARYGGEIEDLLSCEGERRGFLALMKRNFGDAGMPPFNFTEEPGKKKIKKYVSTLRGAVRWRWLRQCRIVELFSILRYWSWEVINLIKPAGGWVLATGENLPDGVCVSSLRSFSLYGEVVEIKYQGSSVVSWLWFRFRYIQRHMARNELLIIRCPELSDTCILLMPFMNPSCILGEAPYLSESATIRRKYRRAKKQPQFFIRRDSSWETGN